MNLSAKLLLNNLYSQCDDLSVYSHHLTVDQCESAFRFIRDIVLFIKTNSDDEYDRETALFEASRLDQLVKLAKNG